MSRTEVFVAISTAGSEDRRSSEGVFLQRFAVSEEAQKRLLSPVLAVMHQLSGCPVHQGTFLLVRNIFVESRMKVFLLSLIATVSVASAGQEGRGKKCLLRSLKINHALSVTDDMVRRLKECSRFFLKDIHV